MAKKPSKIWIQEVLADNYDPEGSFDSIIFGLERERESHPDCKDFAISKEWGGYDAPDIFKLVAMRLESDKEYEVRLAKIQKEKEKKAAEKAAIEDEQRELYEKLKKKFEKQS